LKQARLHALDGRFDEAIYSLIEAVRELAESVAPAPEAGPEDDVIQPHELRCEDCVDCVKMDNPSFPCAGDYYKRNALSKSTRLALLVLRRAFFDLLAAARGREWDQLAYKYPFSLSFDELADRVAEWVEAHCGEADTR